MTSTTPTTQQLHDLRSEAGSAGDAEMVAICDRALEGDAEALSECADVIAAARAMETE